MAAMVRLEWTRFPSGFDLVEDVEGRYGRPPEGEEPLLWLEAREPKTCEPYVIEGTNNQVFLELANASDTAGDVQAFVNKWGLPALNPFPPFELTPVSVMYVAAISWDLRQAIAQTAGDSVSPKLEGWLAKRHMLPDLKLCRTKLHGDTAPRVFLKAKDLQDFCFAEFMQWLDTGNEIRRCLRCGTLFGVGKVGNQPIYCSNACRISMHRKQKRAQEARAANMASVRKSSRR